MGGSSREIWSAAFAITARPPRPAAGRRTLELLVTGLEGVRQKAARGDEQDADRGMCEPVVDGVADAFGRHDVVAFQHGQVLGEQRRLDVGGGQDLTDRGGGFVAGGQDLEDADTGGVSERLEQVRFDFVQRPLSAAGGSWWAPRASD